jgi:predicted ATPase
MALFGVPDSHEDDPERAVKASLEMMDALPEISRSVSKHIGREVKLGVHIGINVGDVVFTRVGSEHKKDYTVMGEAVNLAARLYSQAETGDIIVSEPVFKASKHLVDYETLPPVTLKGIDDKVRIFKPVRLKEMPESKRGMGGIYSLLVGRDSESELLKNLIREKGKVILISGDAGLGKTRLAAEARQYAKGVEWIEGRCLSYGENMAYWPFKEIMKRIFDIRDTDSPDAAQKKLLSQIEKLFPDNVEEVAPYIANLFSLRVMEEKVKYLDPETLKLQTFVSVRSLVNRMGARNGGKTVLVIDDYHWIDDASVELLRFILRESVEPSFLLLSRPLDRDSEKARLLSSLEKNGLKRINLSPLDTDMATSLVRSLLKAPEPLAELESAILTKASGNPYYIEEMLKSLMDSGHLVFDSGVWKTDKEIDRILLPQTVQGVIASRIDLLPDDAKNVLQVASVIGRSFHRSILERICPDDLSLRLAVLETLEFIRKEGDRYDFANPLVHEVAYNALLKKRRRELHKEVGESMEQLFGDRITDFCALLSHHFYAAWVWDKAYDYSYRSANLARASYDNIDAIELYNRAIDCLEADTEDVERNRKKIVVLQEKADVLVHVGELDRGLETLDQAVSISREIEDKASEGRSLLRKTEVYQRVPEYDRMAELARATFALFEEIGDEEGKAESLMKIGNSHFYAGRYDDALESYFESLGLIRKTCRKDLEGRVLNNIGAVYTTLGDRDKSMSHMLSALKIAKEIGEKRLTVSLLENIAEDQNGAGDHASALENLASSLKIAQEIGYRRGEATSYLRIGDTYLDLGKFEKSMESIQLSLKISKEMDSRDTQAWSLLRLGETHGKLGNHSLALKHLSEALVIAAEIDNEVLKGAVVLAMAGTHGEKGDVDRAFDSLLIAKEMVEKTGSAETVASLEVCYAGLCLDSGRIGEAETHAGRAMELSQELKLKPVEAEVLLLLGRLHSVMGRPKDMRVSFTASLRLFKELGAPFELARAYYYFGQALKGIGDSASSGHLRESESMFESFGAKEWLVRVRSEII